MPVFKIKSTEGDNKMKVVHWNLLIPLCSDPSDHTNVLYTESMVDQTVNTDMIVAVSAVSSYVQNMSDYSGAWVASLFQQGLQFVTPLFE